MTRTVFVANLEEIKFVKISCKKCGYAMQLPLKIPGKLVVHDCPSCGKSLPISHEEIKSFLSSLRSLQDIMKNNNFSNTLIEIETEKEIG